jgi:hypothetical protein
MILLNDKSSKVLNVISVENQSNHAHDSGIALLSSFMLWIIPKDVY